MVMVTNTGTAKTKGQWTKDDTDRRMDAVLVMLRIVTIAVTSLIIAFCAFSSALVRVVAMSNPAIALNYNPNDATALVVLADATALTGLKVNQTDFFSPLAMKSLYYQSLNPRALRLLASTPNPSILEVRRWLLLDISQRLSRRDVGTQLLLIAKYAQTDKIDVTLHHYNIALTTELESRDTLFPVLAAAIEDPSINKVFANYLATEHNWVDGFIRYKLDRDISSNALVDAANGAPLKPSSTNFAEMRQYLFERSVQTGHYDAAKLFYRKYVVSDPIMLTSVEFLPVTDTRRDATIRWRLFELPYVVPQFNQQVARESYELSVSASSSGRGTVATKLLLLPPGAYRVDISYGNVDLTPSTFATWILRCVGAYSNPVVWATNVSDSTITRDVITVPQKCGAQVVELNFSAGPDQRESVFTVKSIGFVRLN